MANIIRLNEGWHLDKWRATLLGNTAVAYAWNGPFAAPIFGTATDHNGPQLQVDGIYWRFPQTTWPQFGVIIPLQAMQWAT